MNAGANIAPDKSGFFLLLLAPRFIGGFSKHGPQSLKLWII
jgi:hypothetical protein